MIPEEALKHPLVNLNLKFKLQCFYFYFIYFLRWILEAKLQKQNSVKQGKRPKHRLKRDDSSYGNFNSKILLKTKYFHF